MSALRAEPEGDEAIRFAAEPATALRLHRALLAARPVVVQDWIHAPDSVLVLFDCTVAEPREVVRAVRALDLEAPAAAPARFELPLVPGGPDLAAVADEAGTTAAAITARLLGTDFTVAAVGGNGLPLLTAAGWDLAVPRLPSPRTVVPAGSIGLAGDRVCVYPVAMPGGWRLVARSPAALVDRGAAEPVPWSAGDVLRFRPAYPWTSG